MRPRPVLFAAVAAVLLPTVLAIGSSVSPASGADGDDTAVTLDGTGRFSDLKVTVAKTEHLTNEVVHLTWSGLHGGSGTSFPSDYLQIMQCWGDEPTPDRQKCEFGGLVDLKYGGFYVATRQLDYGDLVDPAETIKPEGGQGHAYVPFKSVTGVTEPNTPSQFFGGYTTNEQPFGRTAGDGTGEDYFEVQTSREAPGLGCGARLENDAVRDCWLVVVPRDNLEVDGTAPVDTVIDSSPLSESNWDNKLSFRMHFDPVGVSCPIGTAEKRLLGHEEVSEAIIRWQPKLCSETGSIFGFSQVSDDLARQKALDVEPWLDFVSHPIDPSTVPEGRPISYAPVAVSALGIAFNFDTNPGFHPPAEVEARRGQRITEMKLNQRLVAKLLTQSYQNAAFSPGMPPANPLDLLRDPEFKELNPNFANLKTESPLVSMLQPLGLSDGNEELWAYIASDPAAAAFINGKADKWGMKVNPRYKGLDLNRFDFPRNDLGQLNLGDNGKGGTIELQELDARPYAADMHEVARSAAKGDTLARTTYDFLAILPTFKKDPLQAGGQRSVLGITDLPTAKRFSLPMVALKNAAGKYVTPTEASIRAGLADMKPSKVPGVLISNPKASAADAYPIPVVSYAVTSPQQLTKADAKAYAAFIKYAVTQGQEQGIEQGKLPDGYLPLTSAMVTQSLKAAGFIARQGDLKVEPTAGPTDTGGDSGDGPAAPVDNGTVPPPATTTPEPVTGPPTGQPVTSAGPSTVSFTTPDDSTGLQRYILLVALAVGVLAGAARPLIGWLYARKGAASQAAGQSL